MTADRRPLWRPFSESATDEPVPADGRARLPAVERAPFLEPADVVPPAAPGARRCLGTGAPAADTQD